MLDFLTLNLSGREFLKLYALMGVGLSVILVVASLKAKLAWGRGVRDSAELIDDELALLSGGWSRLSYLMVLRLIHAKCVKFQNKFWSTESLVALEGGDPSALSPNEKKLLEKVQSRGGDGMPVKEVASWVESSGAAIEENLAVRGLRAVGGERRVVRSKLMLAVWLFVVVGIVRVFQGIQRDEPFMFVVIIGVLGSLVLYALANLSPVTRSGKRAVRERKKHVRNAVAGGASEAFAAYAGLGWIGITGTSFAEGLGPDVRKHFQTTHASSDGGGNSDSGGDSGGCGGCGGGCGGCGS